MAPFARLVVGVWELAAAAVLAAGVMLLGVKKTKLIGKEEADMLASIPIPAVSKLLKFMSA